ncbi:MAG: hypothetical protein ACOVP2_01235 [Armatimonadaceae bacterium]
MAKVKTKQGTADASDLPELESALKSLYRLQFRALWMLAVRVVLLSMLITVLRISIPGIRSVSMILDAVAGSLALWPFWTSIGRNWAWRYKLADSYIKASRFDDALAVLEPLQGVQARLFDADGHGRALKALAMEKSIEPR